MSQTASANTCMYALCLQSGKKRRRKLYKVCQYLAIYGNDFLYTFLYSIMLKKTAKRQVLL